MMDSERRLKVFEEREHLDYLIGKLEMFLDSKESEEVGENELTRLRSQLYFMSKYSQVLTERLESK